MRFKWVRETPPRRAAAGRKPRPTAISCEVGILFSGSMKQDASFFAGYDPALIYIAKKLKDALHLESVFTSAGVDYGVEADEYRGGVLFQSVRVGAFFYVRPDSIETAHEVMRQHGFTPYHGAAD